MFRKLLNVGKGHSIDKLHQHSQSTIQNQQQQSQQNQLKNQFEFCELKSYGFSHLTCIGYSSSLSLLAIGSKQGLVRILGAPSIEFNYELENCNSITQLEFIDCREPEKTVPSTPGNKQGNKNNKNGNKNNKNEQVTKGEQQPCCSHSVSAQLVALTDNGCIHLLELRNVKEQNFADIHTQTEIADCCNNQDVNSKQQSTPSSVAGIEYSSLEHAGSIEYFRWSPDNEDRSKRVSTIEISSDNSTILVGTEGGNLYLVPLKEFEKKAINQDEKDQVQEDEFVSQDKITPNAIIEEISDHQLQQDPTEVSLSVENNVVLSNNEEDDENVEGTKEQDLFNMIKFDENISGSLSDEIKHKKPGAIESIKRHPNSADKILLSYHRGLSVIYDLTNNKLDKYFYHNQALESSCFASEQGDIFYTSHNDGSYIRWDCKQGSQSKANQDFLGQLYGPYPCKPTPKIRACTGLMNDQLEELIIFSDGMPRATYDDKYPVTIVKTEQDGKDSVKTVLDFTSRVLDFVVITKPRGNLGVGSKSSSQSNGPSGGGGGKKNKNKNNHHHQQHNRNAPIAVALAILTEEEFVVIDLFNSDSYLEFPLPYLNCIHSSAITCSQLYSDISENLYEKLKRFSRQLKGKSSPNEWPINGGKVIESAEIDLKSHDILLTGHEDGSISIWDLSNFSMRQLLNISTSRFYSTTDDDLIPTIQQHPSQTDQNNQNTTAEKNNSTTEQQTEAANNANNNQQSNNGAWPPLKRVGRFDPFSDDARLAIRRLSLCPQSGTLVAAGTGGQVLLFQLNEEERELESLSNLSSKVTLVTDRRFVWKGHDRLPLKSGKIKQASGYQVTSSLQLVPPVAATSLELKADWQLFALGTSYGFLLFDYQSRETLVSRSTLNPADFAIISGDAPGTMSRKKSFRKSLRESFRRLRLGRSTRQAAGGQGADGPATRTGVSRVGAFSRPTTGVRTLVGSSGAPKSGPSPVPSEAVHRSLFSGERQVEVKTELSSIVRCLSLTWSLIGPSTALRPSLWVGTNGGQVLIYSITLASHQSSQPQPQSQLTSATTGENNTSSASSPEETTATTTTTTSTKPIASEAKLAKEIQLKHRAPIVAIFVTPNEPATNEHLESSGGHLEKSTSFVSSAGSSVSDRKSPDLNSSAESGQQQSPSKEQALASSRRAANNCEQQPARVLICTEEQFKVFNLPNLKPFCKFKLTANEGLRARKVTISHFRKAYCPPIKARTQLTTSGPIMASKSLHSFATTQTSRPTSPELNGSHEDNSLLKSKVENNNSPNQLNQNNHHNQSNSTTAANNQQTNELMAAKFGTSKTQSNSTTGGQQQQQIITQAAGDGQLVQDESLEANSGQGFLYEPYLICMSNQGDCAIYSVPELKRQAQIQVCKREDVNGIQSTMLTPFGEGYYLKSSSNFLRFSLSNQRRPRILAKI